MAEQQQTVVISGGTSGIGLAVARLYRAQGACVYLLARRSELGEQVAQELGAHFLAVDLSTQAACQQVAAQLRSLTKQVEVVVHAAGAYAEESLRCVTEESYAQLMDINVKGTLFLTQALLPLLGQGASVVTIASDAGLEGNYGCPVYCASKGAVVALTRALALDLAPSIRVNCVCPGDVATPLLEKQLAGQTYSLEQLAQEYPLGRIATAEEVAQVVCFVASPQNSFMTGAIIPVDGGLTAR